MLWNTMENYDHLPHNLENILFFHNVLPITDILSALP